MMKSKMMLGLMVLGLVAALLPRAAEAGWARATGGDLEYEERIDGVTWMIHVFTNVGTWSEALEITQAGEIEYLVVAGGGGGGAGDAGDGGNGGPGLTRNITGADDFVTYARGGDAGTSPTSPGVDAEASTGNGGQGGFGGSSSNLQDGGKGGSGIVVVRYQLPPSGTVLMIK